MKVIDDDDDDDERKNWKKAKFVSNDRSGHDDQFCPKIVQIGAILAIFEPFEVWTRKSVDSKKREVEQSVDSNKTRTRSEG